MGGREMRDGMYSEWNTTVSEEPFWLLEAVLCLNWSEMLDSGEWLEKGNGWPRAEKEAFLEPYRRYRDAMYGWSRFWRDFCRGCGRRWRQSRLFRRRNGGGR